MYRLLTVMCLTCVLILNACGSRGLTTAELASIEDSVSDKLHQVVADFEIGGLQAAVKHMSKAEEIETRVGTVYISCVIAAEFYNPNDTVTQDGKDITLPVGIYTRADKGIDKLENGYQFRDAKVTIFAKMEGEVRSLVEKSENLQS